MSSLSRKLVEWRLQEIEARAAKLVQEGACRITSPYVRDTAWLVAQLREAHTVVVVQRLALLVLSAVAVVLMTVYL